MVPDSRSERSLDASGLSMTFVSTKALIDVSLHVDQGECLGVVGRNGAGKSTIVSILTGLRKPDTGRVRFLGEDAPPAGNPAAWQEHVACVYQHSMLVPTLTVAENVFLNRPLVRRGRVLNWPAMRRAAEQVMSEWGFDVDVTALASDISVEERQVVEIARALSMGTRCLILDEPTAALERGAVERLFASVKPLMASGVGVIYISHHLDEVFDLCDRVTILRDGRHIITAPTSSLTEDQMVSAMVGEQAAAGTARPSTQQAEAAPDGDQPIRLRIDNLVATTTRGHVDGVDMTVRAGECLGLLGLRGSGTTIVADIVAGFISPESGEVRVDSRVLRVGSPAAAIKAGIGYVPEDRHARGYIPLFSVAENITMSIVARFTRWNVISRRRRTAKATQLASHLSVASAGIGQPVGELSGGNQQKVVVGRALASAPKVLVAVAPTQGVDVASKESLMSALDDARRNGASVLLVSDDLDDLEYATRILVMVRGRIFAEFTERHRDRQELIAASEGLVKSAANAAASPEPGEPASKEKGNG